jgi:hypothetical protein
MIMDRFKITQGIIEQGIDKTIKDLTKLKSLLGQSFLKGRPITVFFDDFNRKDAGKITARKLRKDSRFNMETIEKAIYIVAAPDFPCSWKEITDNEGAFKRLNLTSKEKPPCPG